MNTLTPCQEVRNKLENLSESFKPEDVKFLLSLNSDFDKTQTYFDAEGMISRLKRFVENGHSTDGLGFEYQKATGF